VRCLTASPYPGGRRIGALRDDPRFRRDPHEPCLNLYRDADAQAQRADGQAAPRGNRKLFDWLIVEQVVDQESSKYLADRVKTRTTRHKTKY
jgi:hypothetical protein